MKNNLVFRGIPKDPGEHTTEVLLGLMVSVMKVHPSRFKMKEYDMNLDE